MIAQTLLAKGIAAERVILDEVSLNTLQNVRAAVRHYRQTACDRFVVCSDRYHTRRIRMFLARHWIAQDGMRVTTAADRLGYDSEASFSRAFKRVIAHAPSKARGAM